MSTHTQTRKRSVARNGYVDARTPRERVRQIDVPEDARALISLPEIAYADAFRVHVGRAKARRAEDWARAIFDEAPLQLRLRLWTAWITLGLRLAPLWDEESIIGWGVRQSKPDFVVVGARSRIGMPAELLLIRDDDELQFSTFVQQRNLIARGVWSAIQAPHQQVVPDILEQFLQRLDKAQG